MAIGPHNDGGREFPLSVLCRLENHKSQGSIIQSESNILGVLVVV